MIIDYIKKILKNLSSRLSDHQITYLMFLCKNRYLPQLKEPRSFNEKINYIKLYNRNPLREDVADRLKVREYIEQLSSRCKLPKIYWHGTNFNIRVWNNLPNEFVIKANHGSSMTLIVDKENYKFHDVYEIVNNWLKQDYSSFLREWIYKNLNKYLIVEEKLQVNGEIPPDFKFFVLNGEVELVQVDLDRFGNHKRNLYTKDFELLDAKLKYPSTTNIKKPLGYSKAVEIAEELSVDFDFIRVDLYLVNDKIYFGELTNTPENGFGKFSPKSLDFELGEKMPNKIIH